jgi:AcrR family transcriptional regulator
MGSKETQARILSAALQLFNEHGTAPISPQRIALAAGISKGHLNYHYRRKRDLISDLFGQMSNEIYSSWSDLQPSIDNLSILFVREWRLMWRYRFFYRELVPLLRQDPDLRSRYFGLRQRRIRDGQKFLDGLVAGGELRTLGYPNEFDLLSTSTWLLTNHWLNFAESTGQMDDEALRKGHQVMLHMIRPYVTESKLKAFDRLADMRFDLESI